MIAWFEGKSISVELIPVTKTVATILSQLTIKEKEQFGFNPEKFIRDVINIINAQKSTKIVEHIEYHELEDTYDSSIFTAGKLPDKEPFISEKAIQNLIFTDGSGKESIEWKFATNLEAATEVVVYAKLPRSFQIPTPVGNYAPDWAIAFNKDKVQHVFFIAETKGSLDDMQLRKIEHNKIECAEKLFNVVSKKTNNILMQVDRILIIPSKVYSYFFKFCLPGLNPKNT